MTENRKQKTELCRGTTLCARTVTVLIILFLAHTALLGNETDDFTFRFTLENILVLSHIKETDINPGNIMGIDELSNTIRVDFEAEGDKEQKASFRIDVRLKNTRSGGNDIELREGWISLGSDISPLFKIGKQRLKWGTGIVWNPTDYVNYAVNPLDLDDPVTGRTLMLFEYPFSNGSITTVFLPDPDDDTPLRKELKDSLLALRAAFLWGDVDTAFTGGLGPQNERNIGISLSFPLGTFIINIETNYGTYPTKPYFIYTSDPDTDPYFTLQPDQYRFSCIVGFNKFIGENGMLMGEIYYNDSNYDEEVMDAYRDLMELAATDLFSYGNVYNNLLSHYYPGYMGKLYAYVSYQHSFDDPYSSVSCSILYNRADSFAYIIPSFIYTGIEDVDLSVDVFIPVGQDDRGEGSLITVYSFVAVWLKVYF